MMNKGSPILIILGNLIIDAGNIQKDVENHWFP